MSVDLAQVVKVPTLPLCWRQSVPRAGRALPRLDHVAGNQPTSTTREPQGWLAPSLAVIAPVVMPRPMHRPPDCSPASYSIAASKFRYVRTRTV